MEKVGKIPVPVYDIKSQSEFIISLCTEMQFRYEDLIPLIFAEWIYNLQSIAINSNQGYQKAFFSYLSHSNDVARNLKKLKEKIEHEKTC